MSIETDMMWEAYLSSSTPSLGEFGFKTEIESAALAGRVPTIIAGGKDVFLDTGFTAPVNSWLGPVIGLASQAIQAFAPQRGVIMPDPSTLPAEARQFPFTAQVPQIMARSLPASCGSDPALLSCFTHQSGPFAGRAVKSKSRQRIKLIREPDGSVTPILCCAPRRMNPLNPRALSRAARRLGSFHRIASNIEKIVQRACKTGIGRKRSTRASYGGSCGKRRSC